MAISLPASLPRLLICGMLVAPTAAQAQTKNVPVVQPHGPVHAQKPAQSALPVPPIPPALLQQGPPQTAAPKEAPKAPEQDNTKGSSTGLPIPRFVSLRSDEVYLRAGPGTRYPIEWVYKRRDLPVEILREFDVWRLVQDPDGTKGWMHQATLSGRRSFIVAGSEATLRHDPQDTGKPVAVLKVGVIGRLRSCPASTNWCQVQVGDYRGYLQRSQIWGTLPDEAVAGG
jgi:SH3-like domain-containing protein